MASFEAEEGFRIGGRVLRKPSSELAKMPAKPDCRVGCACVLATGAMQAISRLWSHGLGSLAVGWPADPPPPRFGGDAGVLDGTTDHETTCGPPSPPPIGGGLGGGCYRAWPPTLRSEGSAR